MGEIHKAKAKYYSLNKLFGAKKKGIWITVEPNISFKLATLTKDGEEYLKNWDMEIIFRKTK